MRPAAQIPALGPLLLSFVFIKAVSSTGQGQGWDFSLPSGPGIKLQPLNPVGEPQELPENVPLDVGRD